MFNNKKYSKDYTILKKQSRKSYLEAKKAFKRSKHLQEELAFNPSLWVRVRMEVRDLLSLFKEGILLSFIYRFLSEQKIKNLIEQNNCEHIVYSRKLTPELMSLMIDKQVDCNWIKIIHHKKSTPKIWEKMMVAPEFRYYHHVVFIKLCTLPEYADWPREWVAAKYNYTLRN